MNKSFTMLVLCVVLGAMLLIMFSKPSPNVKDPSGAASGVARPGIDDTRAEAVAVPSTAPSQETPPAPTVSSAQAPMQTATPTPSRNASSSPPSLPKVEPPASVAASGGGRQPAAQPQSQGTSFFSIPPAPPASKRPEKVPSGTASVAQLEKRTEVPLRGGVAPMPPANRQKAEVAPVAGSRVKADPQKEARESKAAQAAAAKGIYTAKSVALHFAGQGMVLRVEAEEPFVSKFFMLPGPDRLVLDLIGNWKNLQAPTVPSNNLVKGSRIGRQPESVRLVLDLARAPKKYEKVQVSPTVVEIKVQ